MAHDVFISYSSTNKPVADAICAGLEAERLRCWIAPRDVLPGQNYGESIIHAIAACRVVVLVFSGATNVSQAVIREAERAMHNNKPIIPFRIEDTPMSPSLEFFLASCHWLDAIKPPMHAHITHLASSVKGLIGAADEAAENPAPAGVPASPKSASRTPWILAATGLLVAAIAFSAWFASREPAPPSTLETPSPASPGITLAVSLAGAGNGAIQSHFADGGGSSPEYRSSESGGVITIAPHNAPVAGQVTVVSPTSESRWVVIPTVELDLKLLNSGTTTAFFQRALLEVASSRPETQPIWLVDGSRLPQVLALRALGGSGGDAPSAALGIASPEDRIDPNHLDPPAQAKSGTHGDWELTLPRPPRSGIEETLFGRIGSPGAGINFEIPLAAPPVHKQLQTNKDPEPLYHIQLRASGETYEAGCDLSQYIQAGEGDRFFLRIESPVAARHRFTLVLEYDDGSGGTKQLKGPAIDATLLPTR